MTDKMKIEGLTERSQELFLFLAEDAGNWNGTPLLDISKEDRGNLTQMKQAGLLTTYTDEDKLTWVMFTKEGKAQAKRFGITIEDDAE